MAHFCPAELQSDLVLCCGLLLCRQDATFQSSSHFYNREALCENELRAIGGFTRWVVCFAVQLASAIVNFPF